MTYVNSRCVTQFYQLLGTARKNGKCFFYLRRRRFTLTCVYFNPRRVIHFSRNFINCPVEWQVLSFFQRKTKQILGTHQRAYYVNLRGVMHFTRFLRNARHTGKCYNFLRVARPTRRNTCIMCQLHESNAFFSLITNCTAETQMVFFLWDGRQAWVNTGVCYATPDK